MTYSQCCLGLSEPCSRRIRLPVSTLRPTPGRALGFARRAGCLEGENPHLVAKPRQGEPKPAPRTSCSSLIVVIASIYLALLCASPCAIHTLSHLILRSSYNCSPIYKMRKLRPREARQLAYGDDRDVAEPGFEHRQADSGTHVCDSVLLCLLPSLLDSVSQPCQGRLSVPEALARCFLPFTRCYVMPRGSYLSSFSATLL